jgi:hypothetical protein
MFSRWGRKPQRRDDDLRAAMIAGEVRALSLILSTAIKLMSDTQRQLFVGVLKSHVGQGITSSEPWLADEVMRTMYNESMSLTLQNFIEFTPTNDTAVRPGAQPGS